MSLDLISGDNHIDLTYCPPDLWSSAAPAQWRSRVPHTIEREDGLHWLVDGKDKGLWNAVGPSFAPHRPGLLARIDAMHEAGFRWDHRPGAIARPTTPELRIADLDRDGQQAEFVYGCLMLGEMIADPKLRSWCGATYNDWAVDFARRADPARIFPLAVIPNHDPEAAAREVRRCAGMGMKGGDLAFKRISPPLWHKSWDTLWRAAAECRFPISFHSTGMPGLRGGDTPQMNKEYYPHIRLVRTALFQLDSMEVLASILASAACERVPDFQFVLAESGISWLPYVLDRLDLEYSERARNIGLRMKPSDYFRRQGFVTYEKEQHLALNLPLIGEDNIIWGSDYPHPDCLWPDSAAILDEDLSTLTPSARRKITRDNVMRLYRLG